MIRQLTPSFLSFPEPKYHGVKSKDAVETIYSVLFRVYLIGLHIIFGIFKVILLVWIYLWNSQFKFVKKKSRVVIVGGGYAGVSAALALQHQFNVVLIDTKDFFEFTPSKLRTLVEPSHASSVKVPHHKILSESQILVENVTKNLRETPTTIVSSRSAHFEDYSSLLKKAQRVAIIGGGTVGVELGAEIIERYPNKDVTLIHSHANLIERSPFRAMGYAKEYFGRKGVRLLLNEKVIGHEGSIIEADLAFMCTGNVPNSDFLHHSSLGNCLNPKGFVQVNPFLQMKGFENIFVAGDITDIPEEEEKLCQTAGAEVKVVIQNIKNMEKKKPLVPYVPSSCPILVSLGRYDGMLTYRGWTLTGFLPAIMKEFVEWKEMIFYWDWKHFLPLQSNVMVNGERVSDV